MEITIYPAGKSLDMCAEMREKGKLRRAPGEGGEGKRRRRKKRKLAAAAANIEEVGVCRRNKVSTIIVFYIV